MKVTIDCCFPGPGDHPITQNKSPQDPISKHEPPTCSKRKRPRPWDLSKGHVTPNHRENAGGPSRWRAPARCLTPLLEPFKRGYTQGTCHPPKDSYIHSIGGLGPPLLPTGCCLARGQGKVYTWNPKASHWNKWLFQLDDSKSLHAKWLFHQTSNKKWLFRVPDVYICWIFPELKTWKNPGVVSGDLLPTKQQVSHEKNPALLSIESWLVNKDPYNSLLKIPCITG